VVRWAEGKRKRRGGGGGEGRILRTTIDVTRPVFEATQCSKNGDGGWGDDERKDGWGMDGARRAMSVA
jgi:hypothetical protein